MKMKFLILLLPLLLIGCTSESANYMNISTGVGFATKGEFVEDLKAADALGLVFLNARADGGEIPEIIRVGFELEYIKHPVPNMAGGAEDTEGLRRAYFDLVERYNPVFIGLGNELELMADTESFVEFYLDFYPELKSRCPDCIIYPVFHYEQLNSELVELLPMDLLVVTSYPFAKYASIHNIPDDYYKPLAVLASNKGVKIGFTEIGWTKLYDSGEKDVLTAFYNRFNELIASMDVQFVSWGILYDIPEHGEEWGSVGLLREDGSKKPVYYSIKNS